MNAIVTKVLTGAVLGAALTALTLTTTPSASAAPYDPHTPIPALSWCPGGRGSTG